jgi:hypothetical protein
VFSVVIKQAKLSRKVELLVCDFIHDFNDDKWKFLNLKYFNSKECALEIKKEISIMKNINSDVLSDLETSYEKLYLKKKKCEGDYCKLDILKVDSVKFGYLRDIVKVIASH